jgi:hypothetical protein
VLDKLLEAANSPKIQPGDFHELVKTLKKLMTDPMVVLVANAVTAAGLLAHGLRKVLSFLAFTGTKVQILTLQAAAGLFAVQQTPAADAARQVLSLLAYWYQSTHIAAASCCCRRSSTN